MYTSEEHLKGEAESPTRGIGTPEGDLTCQKVIKEMSMSKLGSFLIVMVLTLCQSSAHCVPGSEWQLTGANAHEDVGADSYTTAYINVSYIDPETKRIRTEKSEIGKFGDGRVGPAVGVLVHVSSWEGDHTGCAAPLRSTWENGELPREPWIALVKRGQCNFEVKVENAFRHNASAVLVYNDRESPSLDKMKLTSGARNMSAVFTYKWKGEQLAKLVDNGSRVMMHITVATHCTRPIPHVNRTSVLFVSISFVVLMLISLAWLVFYYVQRFRYIHAKDRLSKRLCNAAKKALSKIPTKEIQQEDREVQGDGECCAVCIEPYKVTDDLRVLPCRHEFHKSCIDPWLLEHRTCPMCKMDILKHYGFVFTSSQESILQIDAERGEAEDSGDFETIRISRNYPSGIRSEPASRVTTPDSTASIQIQAGYSMRQSRDSDQSDQLLNVCEHRHCIKCCSKSDKLKRANTGCCILKQSCCGSVNPMSGKGRDPDTAQLLGNDNFYDSQSTDSSMSSPVHRGEFDCDEGDKIKNSEGNRPSHIKSNKFFHTDVCDSKKFSSEYSHRRSVSCNDLDELVKGKEDSSHSNETDHGSVFLTAFASDRLKPS